MADGGSTPVGGVLTAEGYACDDGAVWPRRQPVSRQGSVSPDPRAAERDDHPSPIDLIVHVGTGKTGSTSIQHFMNLNRDRLREAGFYYPETPGRSRHAQFTVFLTPDEELDDQPVWHRLKADDPDRFRRRFRRRLLGEIADSGLSRVVLSEETIFKSSDGTLRRLDRFARRNARSLRIVVYLRRQDDHLVSRYQQGVKVGEVRRLADPDLHRDYSDVYDYAGRLALLAEILKPDEMVVRRYERAAFAGGELFRDFLEAIGAGADLDRLQQPEERNVSFDAETVEFLRLLNIDRVESEGARAGMIDNRHFLPALAAPVQGPTLTLPASVLDDFMAQFEQGNQEVARRWFGEEDGVLFRTPRRTSRTTTVQRVEPDRIDHFADLLDLPDDVRARLRALAEREHVAG